MHEDPKERKEVQDIGGVGGWEVINYKVKSQSHQGEGSLYQLPPGYERSERNWPWMLLLLKSIVSRDG